MAFMKSAILVCVTAVLTVYLPQLWTKALPIITAGTVQPGFEPVAKLFRENFENGVEYPTGGSAFSVYYKGSKVVDIWGGYADSEAGRPWKEDTLTIVFSATKGMAALCMAVLVDRGHLDYDKTVASYWPQFAQNGKEKITVRTLLNHKAGLSEIGANVTLLGDQDALGEFLARYAPEWEPGTAQKYHALSFGLYASQLLRRADPKHRTLGQFFKEEIAQPFGIDFHIGLPLELYHRYPRLSWASTYMWFKEAITSRLMRQFIWKRLMTGKLQAVFQPVQFNELMVPEILALEQPSAWGVGTARALAKVYGILANGGATLKGQRILSEDIIKKVMDEVKGTPVGMDGSAVAFNLGFAIEKNAKRFGHPGLGGMHGIADPQRKLGFGYVSSFLSTYTIGRDNRFHPLLEETYKCIEKLDAK